MLVQRLQILATELRMSILQMLCEAKSGHPGGSLSAIDCMTALFFHEMKGLETIDLHNTSGMEQRDHFILSKGHAVPALYSIFAKKGWILPAELKTLRQLGSRLQGHPDRVRLPIVEASTGSLGQGLSIAQGMALGLRMQKSSARIYCLLGDGEIQEGQIWEAALSAPHFGLSNLCVILDANNGQIDGAVSSVMPIEPILAKWKAFGWDTQEIDGHDFEQIMTALQQARLKDQGLHGQPSFILARTLKGKGVSFMENQIQWHGTAPSVEQTHRAMQELQKLLHYLTGGC